jgi:hypothetical protein
MSIINTFVEDGFEVDYPWEWHLEHPELTPIPGVDYKVAPGHAVRAGVTGDCSWSRMNDGFYLVSIQYGKDALTYRELASVSAEVKTGHIVEGHAMGTASNTKSPHWEYDHADGTYSPAEDYVTPPAPKPVPKPATKRDDMFGISTKSSKGAQYWALVSEDLQKFVPIGKLTSANALAGVAGKPFAVIDPADWNGFRTAAGLEPIVIP